MARSAVTRLLFCFFWFLNGCRAKPDSFWQGKDAAATAFNQSLYEKSLRKMREYGITTYSGVPNVRYGGFEDGQPAIGDFVEDLDAAGHGHG